MIGTLRQVYEDMKKGVTNFCVDGKCSGCGKCCSALLPVSTKEIKEIRRYVKKKGIKPVKHNVLAMKFVDWTCPFLDDSRSCERCLVYPVRPKICRTFQCNQPPSEIRENKEQFWKERRGINMWEVDWDWK